MRGREKGRVERGVESAREKVESVGREIGAGN